MVKVADFLAEDVFLDLVGVVVLDVLEGVADDAI